MNEVAECHGVSVVIPCLGQSDLVDIAVQSCLRQSFLREIIIVADQAATESAMELDKIAAQVPEVRLFRLDKGCGEGAARNAGAAQATGDFLCFLDPYDELLSDFFAQALPLLKSRSEFSAIRVGIQILDQFGSPLILPGDPRYTFLMSSVAGNLLVRRAAFERLGGFSEDPRFDGILAGAEPAFSRAIDEFLAPVGYMPEAFYRRNVRPGSPVLQFLWNTRMVNDNVFEFLSVHPEQSADAPLAQAIDGYLKSVGYRMNSVG